MTEQEPAGDTYYLLNGIKLSREQKADEESDLFRRHLQTKDVILSSSVATLDLDSINEVIEKVKTFTFTTKDVDVLGGHGNGVVAHGGDKFYWNIIRTYKGFGFSNPTIKLGIRLDNERDLIVDDVFSDNVEI